MTVNIDHPFLTSYDKGSPRVTPRSAYKAHLAITEALSALAERAQVYVWTLHEIEDNDISNTSGVCGVYTTLKGAVEGARAILADSLVPELSKEQIDQNFAEYQARSQDPASLLDTPDPQRLRYVDYLIKDVEYEQIDNPVLESFDLGYVFRVSYGDKQQTWLIQWHEVMP